MSCLYLVPRPKSYEFPSVHFILLYSSYNRCVCIMYVWMCANAHIQSDDLSECVTQATGGRLHSKTSEKLHALSTTTLWLVRQILSLHGYYRFPHIN